MNFWELLRHAKRGGMRLSTVSVQANDREDEAITLAFPPEELEALRREHQTPVRSGSSLDAPSQQ